MAVIEWPSERFRMSMSRYFIDWTSRGAGTALSGHNQIIGSGSGTGTGVWRLTFALIVEPSPDRLRRFEALVSEMRGQLNTAAIPLFDAYTYDRTVSGQTQAALFIGARKTSDATNGVLIEQGPNATTAPGFNIFAPAGTIEYRQWLRVGTSNTSISFDSDLYAAPHSAALTGLFATGAQQVARVNGTQQATAAPAGMLARDVIHLGARAGANSFFSGLIGPVVLRGGPLPDSAAIATIEAIITARIAAADPVLTVTTPC